jgi:hypothetical protein
MSRFQHIPSRKKERLEQTEREETSEIRLIHGHENTHLVQNIIESFVALSIMIDDFDRTEESHKIIPGEVNMAEGSARELPGDR